MTPADLDLITAIAHAAQPGRIQPGDVPHIARNSTATRTHWARSPRDTLRLAAALRQAWAERDRAIAERDRARGLAAGLEIDGAENCTCRWPF